MIPLEIRESCSENDAFTQTLTTLKNDPRVKVLKKYGQHQGNTTYQHCLNVANGSYKLAKWLHLRIDGRSLAVGAMLHDYYLYSTKEMTKSSYEHGVSHPQIALENAETQFELNERERNIIQSHMWPLTLRALPKEREAVLVSVADKYCALYEMWFGLLGRYGLVKRSQAMH